MRDDKRFSRALWFARHPRASIAIYVGFAISWLAFVVVFSFGVIQFVKWAWNL